MSYRDRNLKPLTLPSGATCKIRKLIGNDFQTIGSIQFGVPDDKGPAGPKLTDAEAEKQRKWSLGLERVIFTQCVTAFQHEGEKFKLVDKPVDSAAKGELEIELLDSSDAATIVSAVINFSGMGKGVAGNGQGFQPDANGHDKPTPLGGELRAGPEPTPQNEPARIAG